MSKKSSSAPRTTDTQTKAGNARGPAPQTNWPSKINSQKSGDGRDNAIQSSN
jgi:hypothetical protein